jgi:hypothetical protein
VVLDLIWYQQVLRVALEQLVQFLTQDILLVVVEAEEALDNLNLVAQVEVDQVL